jgi:hypothetical protein
MKVMVSACGAVPGQTKTTASAPPPQTTVRRRRLGPSLHLNDRTARQEASSFDPRVFEGVYLAFIRPWVGR